MLCTYGPTLDQPLDIICMGTSMSSPGGNVYPLHPIADWRGNFIDGADWEGKRLPCGSGIPCLINWPTYSAFRGRTPATQTTFFGSLVFGKEDASGFTYMRNRYYNPQTGSFTQTDPIGLAGGLNTYGFAAGDPVSYSDPYGLCKRDKDGNEDPECRRVINSLRAAAAHAYVGRGERNLFAEAADRYEAPVVPWLL